MLSSFVGFIMNQHHFLLETKKEEKEKIFEGERVGLEKVRIVRREVPLFHANN
jgi:hypothetical protein